MNLIFFSQEQELKTDQSDGISQPDSGATYTTRKAARRCSR